jgi:(p)ppGpp synthase/HD superfamily hydrolase
MTGYSDRINHALAFAAKHHDQRVRRGTRTPYSTQSANLAVILTRYGRDEDSVTAGILLDVVEDYVRDGSPPELVQHRIADKFGPRVLDIALQVAERRTNDQGQEIAADERRRDQLERIGRLPPESHALSAAEALHNAGTLLADLRRTVDVQSVWSRVPGGRERALESFRERHDRLAQSGLNATIVDELGQTLVAIASIPTELPEARA